MKSPPNLALSSHRQCFELTRMFVPVCYDIASDDIKFDKKKSSFIHLLPMGWNQYTCSPKSISVFPNIGIDGQANSLSEFISTHYDFMLDWHHEKLSNRFHVRLLCDFQLTFSCCVVKKRPPNICKGLLILKGIFNVVPSSKKTKSLALNF